MKYIWIEAQGTLSSDKLKEKLLEYCGGDRLYLAYFTDGFTSGNASENEIKGLAADTLLEVRIFCDEMEFLARRSDLGGAFKWRLASDHARSENFKKYKNSEEGKLLPAKEEMIYLIRYQTLDIKERLQDNRLLSMVGGSYTLPLKENESAAKVMTYLSYDERGMASAVDFRICGFAEGKNEVRSNG